MSTSPTIPPPPDGSAAVALQSATGAIPPPPDGSAIVAQGQPNAGQSAPRTVTGQVASISTPQAPKSTMGRLAQWIDNVTLDMQDGGDRTGVGTVLQKLGAHGLSNGNSQAVGDYMASLPLGLLKAGKGAAELVPSEIGGETGKTWKGVKDLVGGGLQAISEPASFVAPEASPLSEEGLLTDAASTASKATDAVASTAAKTKGAVTDVLKGEKVAQAPAQQALRTGAKASAADAGIADAASTATGSVRNLLDDPIEALASKERDAYDTINDASGTDLKSLYDHAEDVKDALDDPTNVSQRTALQSELKTTQDAIQKGEAQATANGVDPDTLSQAKEMTKQRYAMENVNSKLFNNESVVSGNVEHGAPETINVNSAIRQVENLDKPSKFAPRGTPSRLVQAFGEDGAAQLKQGLYDAQKAGKTALSRQQLAKTAGKWAVGAGVLAGGGELLRHAIE